MELFNAITKANRSLQGRVQGIQYGIVASVDDPLGLGRIQCLDAAKGGKSLTDWLHRVLPFPGYSAPLPQPGQTVLIGYIDGDPHQGIYWGVLQNLVNPVINQGDNLVITVGSVTLQISPDGSVDLSGVDRVTINGKQVTTLGAKDSDGDTLVQKGW